MAGYSISRRRAIALLLLTSIMLITLDVNGNPVADKARSAFAFAMQPFDSAALVVYRPLQRAWNGIANYNDVENERDALRAEVESMRGGSVAAQARILESNELLQLNRLGTLSNIQTVTAQVVGEAPSNFQLTVEINKGSEACIATGMPVVGPGGLIGKVTEAHNGSAVVMLITDPRYAVGVKILSSPNDSPTSTSAPPDTAPSGVSIEDLNSTTTSSTTTTTTIPESTTTTTQPRRSTGSTSTSTSVDPAATGDGTTSTSTSTTMPAEVLRETGLMQGRGPDAPPQIELVEKGQIEVGDSIATAGGADDLAPDGIPIGTVSRVISRTSSAGPVLEVAYSADIDHLNFVSVMLYRPASEKVICG